MTSRHPRTIPLWSAIAAVLAMACARGELLGDTTNRSDAGDDQGTGGMTATGGGGGDEAGSGGSGGSSGSGGSPATGGSGGTGGSESDASDDGSAGSGGVAGSGGGDASAGSGGAGGAGGSGGAGGAAGDSGPPTSIYIEAESGVGANTAPMATANDALASGGKYIWKSTTGSSNNTQPADGHVTYAFSNLPAGVYKVWGRFLAGAGMTSDDSLWVRMDSGTWTQWNDIYTRVGAVWGWDAVHDSPAANVLVTYTLTAGTHTLEIAYREDGLKIDRFLLTNDLAMTP
jgi:hypothetical protein